MTLFSSNVKFYQKELAAFITAATSCIIFFSLSNDIIFNLFRLTFVSLKTCLMLIEYVRGQLAPCYGVFSRSIFAFGALSALGIKNPKTPAMMSATDGLKSAISQ